MDKSPDAFRTISEVADWLGVPTHVLRFWESRFVQVKPVKRAGGRRYYRPADMRLIGGIKRLLHDDGMTIRGVQKILRESGVRHVQGLSPAVDEGGDEAAVAPHVLPHDGGHDGGRDGRRDGRRDGAAHMQAGSPDEGEAETELVRLVRAATGGDGAGPPEDEAASDPDTGAEIGAEMDAENDAAAATAAPGDADGAEAARPTFGSVRRGSVPGADAEREPDLPFLTRAPAAETPGAAAPRPPARRPLGESLPPDDPDDPAVDPALPPSLLARLAAADPARLRAAGPALAAAVAALRALRGGDAN